MPSPSPSAISKLRNITRIALPFVLILVGAAVFYLSPWPAILHLMLKGARVRIVPTWQTAGLPAVAALCWAVAIWLSLQIRPHDPSTT